MPRKRKELAPKSSEGDTAVLTVHPRVQEVFEKYGDPIEEMAKMAKELAGDRFSDDAISTRARLLTELARYGYAQFKGRDADASATAAQKVEINIVGLAPPKVVDAGG
jgi:hypothetical protein